MAAQITQLSPINRMAQLTSNKKVEELFKSSMGDNAGAFLASLIDLYGDPSGTLQECDPQAVVMEALKAATLKLPINKNLGFAYIIPYKKSVNVNGRWDKVSIPQFQMGYKGFIQLAMRSGQYKTINSNVVYEGMSVEEDYLTGDTHIAGKKESDTVIGYFCYFKLINGFEKTLYWSKDEVVEHAKKFSQGYNSMLKAQQNAKYKPDNYVWDKNFDEMALKTVTKRLLSKYGVLSTDMQSAFMNEADDQLERNLEEANSKKFDPKQMIETAHEVVDTETGEILEVDEVEETQQPERVNVLEGIDQIEEINPANVPW